MKLVIKANSGIKPLKNILLGIGVFTLVILAYMSVGINNAGNRTVVQWPNGHTFVKFSPGIYVQAFGTTWKYNDVLTFDFDTTQNSESATIDQKGIRVRYQDGGLGEVLVLHVSDYQRMKKLC